MEGWEHIVSPRVGHLDALYHIFAYLRGHPNMGRIAYNPVQPKVDYSGSRFMVK